MASAQEVVKQVDEFLAQRIALEELEDWSASFAHSVYRDGDAQAQEAAGLLRSILNAYEDDGSEDALREELAVAIRPFAQQRIFVYGKPRPKPQGASVSKPLVLMAFAIV
jgi:hypothetical protein